MRTTNFSRAPAVGQSEAMVGGRTRFTSPVALRGLVRRWVPMVRRLKASPGYRAHYVFYRFPLTLGTIAFFADRESLLRFARCAEHVELMRWSMAPGNAHGGFIRLFRAERSGYSSGVWRAEPGQEMRHIERFSPLRGETEPPRVDPRQEARA